MTLIIQKPTGSKLTLRQAWQPMDPDAAAYITAVETADEIASPGIGALEEKTKIAIDNFVLGCKADGIWNAIKASCILAGARTLAGALVPLVGTAPTNYNFVAGDYNRKIGLKSDGSSKYLASNRANNTDPQNNRHRSIWVSQSQSSGFGVYIGAGTAPDAGADYIGFNQTAPEAVSRCLESSASGILPAPSSLTGFLGHSRASSSLYNFRFNKITSGISSVSTLATTGSVNIFRRDNAASANTNARLAFYSIGESLDLALLDARVSTLMSDLAAAIP